MTDEEFVHTAFVELGIRPERTAINRTYTLASISPVRIEWTSPCLGAGWDYRTYHEAADFIRCFMLDELARMNEEKLMMSERAASDICFDRVALLDLWNRRTA